MTAYHAAGAGRRIRPSFLALLLALQAPLLVASGIGASADSVPPPETLSWDFKEQLLLPMDRWAASLRAEKNADGAPYKKGNYSRSPRKNADGTWSLTAHVNIAEPNRQVTERYDVTLTDKTDRGGWQIADQKLVDTYVALYRATGMACRPFQNFTLDREGMKVTASNGSVCEAYLEGQVSSFALSAPDLRYEYAPPPHAQKVSTGHDFSALSQWTKQTQKQLDYAPAAAMIQCDVTTCDALIESSFQGLDRVAADKRGDFNYDKAAVSDWLRPYVDSILRARKDDPFSGYRVLDYEGHRWYSILLPSEMQDRDDGVELEFDSWGGGQGGWEVTFNVWPKRWDVPNQVTGAVYGYFSEATLASTDPYDLERREDSQTRWFEVQTLSGEIDLAIDTPDKLEGDVTFGLTIKQHTKVLPFYIVSRASASQDRPRPIVVNSVEVEGQEVTWVQTGPISGLVVLPQEIEAGTLLRVRMDWESQTVIKFSPSYSYMPRGGWMPFVRFGDLIDAFELTIRSPAEYDILGVGHKVSEETSGGVRISHWKAESPVNFPTIIFGRYESDVTRVEARKLDETMIPVQVHVDKSSFVDWGIAPKSLRPIATQAANSLNLYAMLSGVDYPFGELNIVNDPLGFLYGQAPSSIIYLGSGVFRGEGALAGSALDATSRSKFLKSVVAHEVGHQWWGNRIANANGRNYWFVESLAEYFSAIYLEVAFGWNEYVDQVEEWRRNIMRSNLKGNVQNASTLFSGEHGGGGAGEVAAYTAAVYNKGPYAFHILRETFKGEGPRGPEGADKRFYEFLKKMSMELAEKREIVTYDIQRAAERALGGVDPNGNPYSVDLGWFFDQWIRGAGMPTYTMNYEVRQSEDGAWLVEGWVDQQVNLGQTSVPIEGFYRGVVEVQVAAKGGPYFQRMIINAARTPLKLRVPEKPVEITLNNNGAMLAMDTKYVAR